MNCLEDDLMSEQTANTRRDARVTLIMFVGSNIANLFRKLETNKSSSFNFETFCLGKSNNNVQRLS